MPEAILSEKDFIEMFERLGAKKMARELGTDQRVIFGRRQRIEKRIKRQLTSPNEHTATRFKVEHPQRVHLDVRAGVVLVFSDAHFWPNQRSTAFRALLKMAGDLGRDLKAIVCNGDALDAATASRHSPIGWESRPSLVQEIEACQERLGEIEKAGGKVRRVWTLGNHDGRFETRLATVAPEYAKIHGVHLKDHFPLWEPAWACWINDSVVVKHRFKNGMHAPHNNALWSVGKHMVTGHLHSAKVQPITGYGGTIYGVDTGCLAAVDSPQFIDYTEDNPRSWRSAFAVLTFSQGVMLQPELCLVHDENEGLVDFRGKLIEV